MFCSHCGKSIRPEDISCPHCGAVLGEDRFVGNMYTSSQVRLPVDGLDQAPAGSLTGYTRTDYMSYDNQPEDDVYSNTTYRPLLNDEEDTSHGDDEDAAYDSEPYEDEAPQGDSSVTGEGDAPESESDAPESESGTPENETEAVSPENDEANAPEESPADAAALADAPADEPDKDAAEGRNDPVSPLPKLKPAGISPAVQRYMREMEARQHGAPKSGFKIRLPFKQKEPEYEDEPAEDIPGMEPEDAMTAQPYPVESDTTDTSDTSEKTDNRYAADPGESWQAEPEADDEYEDYEEEQKKPKFKLDLSVLKTNRTVQIVIAAVLVVAVLIGGIRWLTYVTASFGTKIAGVTHDTYSKGIELITEYVSDTYRGDLVAQGAVNADYAKNKLSENMAALNALLPAEPQENDQIFVTTLTIIQRAIEISVMADADAAYQGTTTDRAAASEQEWAVIKNAVATLTGATNVSQLSAIAADVETAVLPSPSPSPTPVPATAAYTTLQEGMMDNSAVEKLQKRLVELSFLAGGADGDFGAKTSAAVKAFQEAAGLTADGIATPETQVALFADNAPHGSVATETPAPSDTPAPEA